MQESAYDEVLSRVQSWSLVDQLKLQKDLDAAIQRQRNRRPQQRRKAREFRGVCRETWKDVDVEEYLRQERASWDD
jgi:hypothetical protein